MTGITLPPLTPIHPAGLRCSSRAYSRYARSSRLAGRAPRRPRWHTCSDQGPKDRGGASAGGTRGPGPRNASTASGRAVTRHRSLTQRTDAASRGSMFPAPACASPLCRNRARIPVADRKKARAPSHMYCPSKSRQPPGNAVKPLSSVAPALGGLHRPVPRAFSLPPADERPPGTSTNCCLPITRKVPSAWADPPNPARAVGARRLTHPCGRLGIEPAIGVHQILAAGMGVVRDGRPVARARAPHVLGHPGLPADGHGPVADAVEVRDGRLGLDVLPRGQSSARGENCGSDE